jgi:hypothetical protein
LETALVSVVADADGAGLKALALPCIGYLGNEMNLETFDQIFHSALKALKGSHRLFDLFISLYSDWPTPVIEKAVAAVNLAWTAGEGADPGLLVSLYRGRYRILLVLTTICLLACTRRAENTLKSFVLILAAYIGAALGLAELVDRFTKNYPEEPVEIAVVILWIVLALGFPIFVRWDIKDVFNPKKSKSSKSRCSNVGSVRSRHSSSSKVVDGAGVGVDTQIAKARDFQKERRTKQRQAPARTRSVEGAGNERRTRDSSRNTLES